MATKTKKHQQTKALKKGYLSPKLIHFGTISDLTSGGSGIMAEGSDVSNKNKHD